MTSTPAPPQAVQADNDRTDTQLEVGGQEKTEKKKIKGPRPGEERKAGPIVRGLLLVLCLLWMLPVIGLLIQSFRPQSEATRSGWWNFFASPQQFTLDSYGDVITNNNGEIVTAFLNSLAVAIPATIIPILIAAFAAYAFSWMEFRGREVLFIIFVGLLVVPLQVAFIPILEIFQAVGIRGTDAPGFGSFLGLWLAHAGFGMPLAVYLLRNYIGALPREIIESARVDGASHFTTFWRLIIPLSVPALAAFAIFQFLWTWNDYLVALILFDSNKNGPVTTIFLYNLIGSQGQGAYLLSAGAFITFTVPLIVFFGLQRFFVRGLTAGSVKGLTAPATPRRRAGRSHDRPARRRRPPLVVRAPVVVRPSSSCAGRRPGPSCCAASRTSTGGGPPAWERVRSGCAARAGSSTPG